MKDLRPRRGHYLIQRLVAEGEHLHQDFKFAISDAAKIAHTFSAFANADGGHLLVGVKDNGSIAGIRTDEDIYLLEYAATSCCVPPQEIGIEAYRMDDGKVVVKASIAKSTCPPVYSIEADGRRTAYLRVADENITAHPLQVKAWQSMHAADTPVLTELPARLVAAVNRADDGIDPDKAATLLGVSRAAAAHAIVTSISLGVLTIEARHGGQFRLKPTDI